MCPGVD